MASPSNPTSKQKLGDFLRTDNYKVPRHQRGFAWSENEVSEFLSDVEYMSKSYNSAEEITHYMGTIVLYNDSRSSSDTKNIIDGQQRITVISLFFNRLLEEKRYILDQLKNLSVESQEKEDFISEIEDEITTQENKRIFDNTSGQREPVFSPSDVSEHEEIYRHILFGRTDKIQSTSFENPSSYRLDEAYDKIDSWFLDYRRTESFDMLKDYKEYYSHLEDLYDLLSNDFVITKFVISDHRQAGRMFNVLNNRGKDLNALDRVKSHIIYQQSFEGRHGEAQQLNKINEMFSRIQENITSHEREFEGDMNRYVRIHWGIFYRGRNVSSGDVPDKITDSSHLPDTPDSEWERKKEWIEEYMESLEDLSFYYDFIYNPFDKQKYYDLPSGPDEDLENSVKRQIYNINKLSGNEGLVSLLLSSFRNLDWVEYDEDRDILKNIITALESIAVRNHKICKTGRNTFEEYGYTYANKLEWWNKKSEHQKIFEEHPIFGKGKNRVDIIKNLEKDINEILESTSMDNLTSKDILSGHYTEGWTGISEKTARYMLFEMEIEKHGSNKHKKILEQNKTTSLEHILPQEDENSKLSEEEHRKYVNRFGNLILLSISENRTASNKKFREKKEDYTSSGSSKMAKIIGGKNETWTKEDIENRTPKIEAFAKERWPKSVSILN